MNIATFRPFKANGGKRIGAGLGDRIERIVKPVAVALRMPCIDKENQNQLRPESPCAKRRNALNEIGKKVGIGT